MTIINFDDAQLLCVGGRWHGKLRDAEPSSFIETWRPDFSTDAASRFQSYRVDTLTRQTEAGPETRQFFLLESNVEDQDLWKGALLARTEAQAEFFWGDPAPAHPKWVRVDDGAGEPERYHAVFLGEPALMQRDDDGAWRITYRGCRSVPFASRALAEARAADVVVDVADHLSRQPQA
ncbi:hypothetical protein QHI69_38210 (plasmid) [Burkholderia gladioli pv. gladioli]|uniref:Uncharacterized protein n=1 Tax=Burkholderia gladioli TaxID=28095 RepID=A0AAW3F817_BURGA|nr:hypothetical protein [Burkholderia gladioli]AJW93770.1 hypothetical protein BM43_7479 [Burkholderia gladioli]ASD84629.1 hypothetical protein CEJ98_37310 [Burkholderia gladioli pv. gladioli]AWY49851.1 hypothetical protein A8H28_00910 [Burkholderia gladioli pv. gladioli]KGC17314.1 hypothetical protein DM48_3379 [Burkholderia gladioli]MDJ1167752.1 hypothetical protein [Burkholderia gladioli pv. gladioli]